MNVWLLTEKKLHNHQSTLCLITKQMPVERLKQVLSCHNIIMPHTSLMEGSAADWFVENITSFPNLFPSVFLELLGSTKRLNVNYQDQDG